jgi:inosose dehydratase
MESTDADLVGLCLDVGHYTVGGGDPIEAIRQYGHRIRHVHMKDVDPGVLQQLRAGAMPGFLDALRARIFTELGNGVLDVLGVVRELARLDYTGWLMCEQDTTWRPPAESAAISRAVLGYALRLAE